MLEKPAISDETLLTALHDHFDLSAAALEFLPIGYDAFAGVYRVRVADGRDYFLKVKKGGVAPVTVAIPRFLKASGIREVIAPLPTTAGELWGAVDDFGMILYPFIEGADAITIDMTADQAGTFGRALKRIHSLGLPPETSAARAARGLFSTMATVGVVNGVRPSKQQTSMTPSGNVLLPVGTHFSIRLIHLVDRAEASSA